MKYVYEFHLLNNWARDNREFRIKMNDDLSGVKYQSKLEGLKQEFLSLPYFQKSSTWMKSLSKRQRNLVPYLYDKNLEAKQKTFLLHAIKSSIPEERRMFRTLVDVLYQTCDIDALWELVRSSQAAHSERIERRMEPEQFDKWERFLQADEPVSYLAEEGHKSDKGFIEELSTYYLTENMPLFKYVLLDVLKIADEDFFIKERELYKKYFSDATNLEQQEMADSLIKKCNLNRVEDLGKLIYEKLKIYRRKPMLWKYVGEEEKKRFSQWIIRLEVKDFFEQVDKSHERYRYWEKFLFKLEDVVVTDEKRTLIMYFSDVVVMEVLGTGAVYVYNNSTFNNYFQKKVDKYLADKEKTFPRWHQPKELKRHELMEKSLTVEGGWLIHSGDWQYKFDYWLKYRLKWEVDKDVLSKEKAALDAGKTHTS
ncbi:hypothetical protein [Pseudalkalibacillus hwajinpoensis]|uniref:hypothetical protein n=1 Tax=Guptibacillus hwajinpoensis TaxID=208199 RepID=UPI00384E916B